MVTVFTAQTAESYDSALDAIPAMDMLAVVPTGEMPDNEGWPEDIYLLQLPGRDEYWG